MFTRETYSLKLDVIHKSTTLLVSYLSSRLLLSLLFCYYLYYYYYYYISLYQTIVHIRSRTARDTCIATFSAEHLNEPIRLLSMSAKLAFCVGSCVSY